MQILSTPSQYEATYFDTIFRHMAKPRLYNTTEEKLQAARSYQRAYNTHQRNKLPDRYLKQNAVIGGGITNGKIKGEVKIEGVIIGSSSTENFIEGLCMHFISNLDDPDTLDVMRGAIDVLQDLHQCAQFVVDNVIEECGMIGDLSCTQQSLFQICRVLTALEDVFTHAILGVSYLIDVHKRHGLKHQIAPDNQSCDIPWVYLHNVISRDATTRQKSSHVTRQLGKQSSHVNAATQQKMAPRSWLLEDQQAFVLTYHESFLKCKKNGNYASFWPPFCEKWEENWPITLAEEPLDENAKLEQIAKARNALQMCLIVKLRNDFGNSKVGCWANAAGNTIVSKLIGDITIKSGKKKSCPLNAAEVYAKKYYASRVQPAVKEELDAMKDALDAPEPKKRAMQVVRKQLASYWENETPEAKEEVAKLAREMKEEREKDVNHDKKELSKELLTEILSIFFTELHDATGWTFSVLLTGPDPTNTGKLDVSSLHIGTTTAGNQFNHAFPKFEESIMVPYFEFASRAFPDQDVADAASLLSNRATPDTPPDTPLQNDTSLPDAQAQGTLPAHNSLACSPTPMDVAIDTSLAIVPSASTSTPDTSLTTVPSASTSMPDTSLTLLESLPLLSQLSAALFGQGMSHADTSLTHTPQPGYNFFQYPPPPSLEDDSIDLDFNNTILPMPPNYRPPSPLPPSSPLPSSSPSSQTDWFPSLRFSADFSFSDTYRDGFDNTFDHTVLQSLTSPPRLQHLSSTLANTAHDQSRTSIPYNNTPTPMAIPAPAHTSTPVEIPTSVQPSTVPPESLTVGPIMAASAVPTAVAGTLPMTTKASKCKSKKSNMEAVSAKHQKKGDAVAVLTENSQHVEGGRGKQQRFQSSRAAAANAIGTT
ncbi:uncharacterized protein F5891DRAFT_974104 [Suillus fuscotomentosus]|uniref:Uncharacterized protein n=1 Tax=Suillus fuscotomentosus TaxID=1912939 RepID=A0AAD4HWJ5_9AGAM|nr:uncharacterized protein F5891DRAFT_974104 [Suillus fuscotomentosus]KAG1908789.1 hypothetical protein F5891DRAFT_974104 [Suillus fuscotomentosus]